MDHHFSYTKTFDERLAEYLDIFCSEDVIPISEVPQIWSSYLESFVDAYGWQAIWHIPFTVCQSLQISYPMQALVFIDSINFINLTASVKIISVNDNSIKFSENSLKHCNNDEYHMANLIHLIPTVVQDRTICTDIDQLSAMLESLRFFYKYLFHPWDIDCDDLSYDWITGLLKPRLRLYYDLCDGKIPKRITQMYRFQLAEAIEKNTLLEKLQEAYQDDEEDGVYGVNHCPTVNDGDLMGNNMDGIECLDEDKELLVTDLDNDDSVDDDLYVLLMNPRRYKSKISVNLLYVLHSDLTKLKAKISLFENPLLRLKHLQTMKIQNEFSQEKSNVWIVMNGERNDSLNEYIKFVEEIKQLGTVDGDDKCNMAYSLQQALDEASPNDIVYIGHGVHYVNGLGNLATGGGSIVNVDYPKQAIIKSSNVHSLFEIFSSTTCSLDVPLKLENLHLKLNRCRNGIKIKSGCSVHFTNCTLYSSNNKSNSIKRALIVDDAHVVMNNCHISNIATAVCLNGEQTIFTMENSTVRSCNTPIQVQSNVKQMALIKCQLFNYNLCAIKIENISESSSTFTSSSSSSESSIYVEYDEATQSSIVRGDIDLLQKLPHLTLKETTLDTNVAVASEVLITPRIKFQPLEDVLSNPKFNIALM